MVHGRLEQIEPVQQGGRLVTHDRVPSDGGAGGDDVQDVDSYRIASRPAHCALGRVYALPDPDQFAGTCQRANLLRGNSQFIPLGNRPNQHHTYRIRNVTLSH
jgi:hypothetical protein